jgi:hypothetical protein
LRHFAARALDAEPGSKPRSILTSGVAERFEKVAGAIEARFPVAAGTPRTRLRLPERADRPIRLEDVASGMAVEVSLEGAREAVAEAADGYLVFSKAHSSGATLLHRPSPTGMEDYLSFDERPRTPSVSYRLILQQGVAGLRLVSGTLEMLDKGGAPRLRVSLPYVVGADGARTDAALSVEGCTVDTNPAAPWGRKVTPPGATACTVRVSWTDHSVAYPALLDPRWSTTMNFMSAPRSEHTATLLASGRVLVAGGTPTDSMEGVPMDALASTEIFDPQTRTWASASPMIEPRRLHAAVRLKTSSNVYTSGNVLVVGGVTSIDYGSYALATAELYDETYGGWYFAESMSDGRYEHTATLLDDGNVLVAGGSDDYDVSSSGAVYDPKIAPLGQWSATGEMSVQRRLHTATLLEVPERTNLHKKVLVVGGNNGWDVFPHIDLFNPTNKQFEGFDYLYPGFSGHQAVVLPSKKVLITGGGPGTPAIVFNLLSGGNWGSWEPAGTMTAARPGHTATLLPPNVVPNGQVLVVGESANSANSTELWNGATGWSVTEAADFRSGHTATALSGGNVLIAGGNMFGSMPTHTSLLYDPYSCTTNAQCASGFCVGGVCCNTSCIGSCVACNLPATRGTCTPKPPTASCSDSNACTTSDRCNGTGACTPGTPVAVDDGNACTTDSCNPSTGSVSHLAVTNGTACNDGNLCTQNDSCQAGSCAPGAPTVCPNIECQVAGSCDPSTGLCPFTSAPDETACNVGRSCTPDGDRCVAGTCLPRADVCTLDLEGEDDDRQYLPVIEIDPGEDYSFAYDINDHGVVVGSSAGFFAWTDWGLKGFSWSETGGFDFLESDPSVPLPTGFEPHGINNDGIISGTRLEFHDSRWWHRAFRFDPLSQAYPEAFGVGPARGINSDGIMTGATYEPAGLLGFFKGEGPMQVISALPDQARFHPTTVAQAIDDDGGVVGWTLERTTDPNPPWDSTFAAFRYSPARGQIDVLNDAIPGGDTSWDLRSAYSTNGRQIVGWGARNGRNRAFRLDLDQNGDAQTLLELPLPGDYEEVPPYTLGYSGIAHDINRDGDIVGAVHDYWPTWPLAAVVWLDGVPYDLNDYIRPDSGWNLLIAQAINNRRPDGSFDVVGYGELNGKTRAFKMRVSNIRRCGAPRDICHGEGVRNLATGTCEHPSLDVPPCNQISLRVDGIVDRGDGTFVAVFGYNSVAPSPVRPVTNDVYLNGARIWNPYSDPPSELAYGFHPGAYLPAFSAGESITWDVNGHTVTASSDLESLELVPVSGGMGVVVGGVDVLLGEQIATETQALRQCVSPKKNCEGAVELTRGFPIKEILTVGKDFVNLLIDGLEYQANPAKAQEKAGEDAIKGLVDVYAVFNRGPDLVQEVQCIQNTLACAIAAESYVDDTNTYGGYAATVKSTYQAPGLFSDPHYAGAAYQASAAATLGAGDIGMFAHAYVPQLTDGNGQWKQFFPNTDPHFVSVDGSGIQEHFDWRLGFSRFMALIPLQLVIMGTYKPDFMTTGIFDGQLEGTTSDWRTDSVPGYRHLLQQYLSMMLDGVRCAFHGGQAVCADVNTGLSHLSTFRTPDPSVCRPFSPNYDECNLNWNYDDLRQRLLLQMPVFEVNSIIDSLYHATHPAPDLTDASGRIPLDENATLCLDVQNGNSRTPAVLTYCSGTHGQKWNYRRRPGTITSTAYGKCLQVRPKDASTANLAADIAGNGGDNLRQGAFAEISDCLNPPPIRQQWTYDPEKKIIRSALGRVLDVKGYQGLELPAPVQLADQNDGASQRWRAELGREQCEFVCATSFCSSTCGSAGSNSGACWSACMGACVQDCSGPGAIIKIPAVPQRISGDFNGDGVGDLIVVTASGSSEYIGLAGGGFAPNVWVRNDLTLGSVNYITGNFNGDSATDLIIVTANGSSEYTGLESGGFTPDVWVRNDLTLGTVDYTTGDFNSDNKTDLVIVTAAGSFEYTGLEGGGFTPDVWVRNDLSLGNVSFVPGYFNHDSAMDLLVVTATGTYKYVGYGGGLIQEYVEVDYRVLPLGPYFTTPLGSVRFIPGDFSGDGRTDLIMVTAEGSHELVGGSIGFGAGGWTRTDLTLGAVDYVPGDFNGDDITDLLIVTAGGSHQYTGRPGGGFNPNVWVRGDLKLGDVSYFKGEFSGDAYVDLGVVTANGTSEFTGRANGGFTSDVWVQSDLRLRAVDYF